MSSPEVERFEVTGDDLENEFNPNRRRFRQSKNQATYGIWADQESDDDERPSFSGSSRGGKDYSAPVNFISGGFKKGSKPAGAAEEEKEEDSGEEEVDPNNVEQLVQRNTMRGVSKPKYGRGKGRNTEGEIGSWEKHTKGIGMKLLYKMGHVAGRGLGRSQQGITTPVEAILRKGRGTIGYYGNERSERSLIDFPVVDSEEDEDKEFQDQLQQWKKVPEGSKKKPKYMYKTAEEIIAKGGKRKKVTQSELSKVKVIDMTGREHRVLSGYQAISKRHDKPDEDEEYEVVRQEAADKRAFDMPELLHNLNLLVDMAEEEIIQNDRQLRYEKDLIVNLKHEQEKTNAICEQEAKQIKKLEAIQELVDSCERRTQVGCEDPLTLDQCADVFKRLQDEFYEEYKIYDLASLAVALIFPLIKKHFAGWDPLTNPRFGVMEVKKWRIILEDPNRNFTQDGSDMDCYERLIWEVWMPYFRTAINKWTVRDCDPIIEVLETWMEVLPPWVMRNCLEQLALPKLQQEVENWNPLTDTMPIHSWLHPWLPLMGERLDSLYAPIRFKLSTALKNWFPSDPSAKMILQPWVGVFQKGHMDAFIVKNIVPKLAMCLQDQFVINPHQQHLDAWNWVMLWKDLIPLPAMVTLLERNFFPKWMQVLCTWLGNLPDYNEVTKWYTGWKSMFSSELLAAPPIKDQFNKALNIMNRAVSGHFQPGAKENVAYLTQTERRREIEARAAQEKKDYEAHQAVKSTTAVSTVPHSFKDLLERKAEENGLIFLPVPNRTQEAKQVYKFGRSLIYIDRGVVFVQEPNLWTPVSLNNLVERAR